MGHLHGFLGAEKIMAQFIMALLPHNRRCCFFIPAALILMSISSHAGAAADEEGFTPLFNGHDLSGWVDVNCAPSTFRVRAGESVTTGTTTGVLRTDKQY